MVDIHFELPAGEYYSADRLTLFVKRQQKHTYKVFSKVSVLRSAEKLVVETLGTDPQLLSGCPNWPPIPLIHAHENQIAWASGKVAFLKAHAFHHDQRSLTSMYVRGNQHQISISEVVLADQERRNKKGTSSFSSSLSSCAVGLIGRNRSNIKSALWVNRGCLRSASDYVSFLNWVQSVQDLTWLRGLYTGGVFLLSFSN